MKVQKGFTLIELVVVMVILGILAAFAIPKFYDFSQQAKIADLNGLAGALNSANVTGHGAALATGATAATGSISMEGTTVSLAYGYPDATAGGIGSAVTLSSAFTITPPTYSSGVATFMYATTSSNGSPTCAVTYKAATSASVPPVVTVVSSGC